MNLVHKSFALLACLAACSRARPPVVPAVLPPSHAVVHLDVHRRVLANGLVLVLQEDHHTPYVAVNLTYGVGSRDDPPHRSGLAHLFEHMMFGGSKHVKTRELRDRLVLAGARGEPNAATSLDRTTYFETIPANQLELALWLESDRLGFFVDALSAQTLERERSVVRNERWERTEQPYGNVVNLVQAAAYPEGHPYHRPVLGTAEDLDAITLDDARAFFLRYYLPDNATLTLVGNFDEAAAVAMTEKYFGPIPRGDAPIVRPVPSPVVFATERTLELEAGVDAPVVLYVWKAPKEGDVRSAAIRAASEKMSLGLSQSMVAGTDVDDKIASSVDVSYDDNELDGLLWLTVRLLPGKSVSSASWEIRQRVAQPMKIGDKQMAAIDAVLTGRAVFGLEAVDARARIISYWERLRGDPFEFERNLDRIRTVSSTEVGLAYRQVVERAHPMIVLVYPSPKAPIAGRRWVHP